MPKTTKTFFSGVQPSGNLHLGNYLGAIKNWADIQEEYNAICCVVNLHAITVPQDPEELKRKTIEVAKLYIASGLDPEKVTIFRQSDVPQHAELMWLLNTITKTGELFKMTQFKDKSGIQDTKLKGFMSEALKNANRYHELRIKAGKLIENISNTQTKTQLDTINEKIIVTLFKAADTMQKTTGDLSSYMLEKNKMDSTSTGLLNYPILMAADILIYDANLVPVGEDQTQHIEITRTLARRFNKKFAEVFTIPDIYTSPAGKKIMSLTEPLKKMSKSTESANSRIELLDEPKVIRKKIMKATTDSENKIYYSGKPEKAGLKNLLNIFSIITDSTPEQIAEDYKDKGYGDLKKDLANALVEYLKPIQDKFNSITDEEILNIFAKSKNTLLPLAEKKLVTVKQAMGLE